MQDFCLINKIDQLQKKKMLKNKNMYITGMNVLSLWYITVGLVSRPLSDNVVYFYRFIYIS